MSVPDDNPYAAPQAELQNNSAQTTIAAIQLPKQLEVELIHAMLKADRWLATVDLWSFICILIGSFAIFWLTMILGPASGPDSVMYGYRILSFCFACGISLLSFMALKRTTSSRIAGISRDAIMGCFSCVTILSETGRSFPFFLICLCLTLTFSRSASLRFCYPLLYGDHRYHRGALLTELQQREADKHL